MDRAICSIDDILSLLMAPKVRPPLWDVHLRTRPHTTSTPTTSAASHFIIGAQYSRPHLTRPQVSADKQSKGVFLTTISFLPDGRGQGWDLEAAL